MRHHDGPYMEITLGREKDRAKELAAECNRMFDEGYTEDEIRQVIIGVRGRSLKGSLHRTNTGRTWAWSRMRNNKQRTVGLGSDEDRAKELAAECNRMFDEGATIDEIRRRVSEITKSSTYGMYRTSAKTAWVWARRCNNKQMTAALGSDETKAKGLAAECNRLFYEGATEDEIRQRVSELKKPKHSRW